MLPLFSETKSIQIYRARGGRALLVRSALATIGYYGPTSSDLRKKSKSDFATSKEETKERASKSWEKKVVREKKNNKKKTTVDTTFTSSWCSEAGRPGNKRFSKGALARCLSSRRCRRQTRWTVDPWPERLQILISLKFFLWLLSPTYKWGSLGEMNVRAKERKREANVWLRSQECSPAQYIIEWMNACLRGSAPVDRCEFCRVPADSTRIGYSQLYRTRRFCVC